MSIASFEQEIVNHAIIVSGDTSLSRKRLMEWRNAEIHPQEGEVTYHIPAIGVWATFGPKPEPKKRIRK